MKSVKFCCFSIANTFDFQPTSEEKKVLGDEQNNFLHRQNCYFNVKKKRKEKEKLKCNNVTNNKEIEKILREIE